jgi:hypothetical protein
MDAAPTPTPATMRQKISVVYRGDHKNSSGDNERKLPSKMISEVPGDERADDTAYI